MNAADRWAQMCNQSPQFNKNKAECPVCGFEAWEEYLPLHIEVNHPVPNEPFWVRILRWVVS